MSSTRSKQSLFFTLLGTSLFSVCLFLRYKLNIYMLISCAHILNGVWYQMLILIYCVLISYHFSVLYNSHLMNDYKHLPMPGLVWQREFHLMWMAIEVLLLFMEILTEIVINWTIRLMQDLWTMLLRWEFVHTYPNWRYLFDILQRILCSWLLLSLFIWIWIYYIHS